MRRVYFIGLLLIVYCSVNGQRFFPGGVATVSLWNVSGQNASGDYIWLNRINDGTSFQTKSGTSLNSNTAVSFNGDKDAFTIPLKSNGKTKAFTIFVVYLHSKQNGEQVVWSISNEGATSLVMTTQCLGDLEQYGYINYVNEKEPHYKIFSYTHNEPVEEEKGQNLSFKIGKRPGDRNLPVKNFNGYIPEVILYERVLNQQERQRVESYLAMKYGISISQTLPTSYLNSGGKIIWNADVANGFKQNITAIGRDDRSGLLQTVSTATREAGILKMSFLQKEKLPDNEFLFWADNGGDLQFVEQKGQFKQTNKLWKITKSGAISGKDFTQEFDLTYFANRFLHNNEQYAIMIDHSGSGNFPVGKVSFIEAKQKENKLTFSDIGWCDANKEEVFSLVTIPPFFARYEIDNPDCGENTGKLQVEINGGVPPYRLQFTDRENAANILSITTTDHLYSLSNISQGDYTLQINDAKEASFSENIVIESTDAKNIPLKSHYILQKGEVLCLSASSSQALSYQWKMPDGQINYNAEIYVQLPGVYSLITDNGNGCKSFKKIEVSTSHSNFSRLILFPNPSIYGTFWLDIGLHEEADIDIRIYSLTGSLISQDQLKGSSYYLYQGNLPPQTGVYMIEVSCNGVSEVLKIIRN